MNYVYLLKDLQLDELCDGYCVNDMSELHKLVLYYLKDLHYYEESDDIITIDNIEYQEFFTGVVEFVLVNYTFNDVKYFKDFAVVNILNLSK